ncbi:hypothetical protein QL285_003126 [Trifolium repens]|nr:hypothetical protein QL285_003126 [Trifolium repens]
MSKTELANILGSQVVWRGKMLPTSSLKLSDEGRGPAKARVLPSSLWGIISSSPHKLSSTEVISGSDTNSESSMITGSLSSTA